MALLSSWVLAGPDLTSAPAPCSSLFHQACFNRVIWRYILHDAAQANLFRRLCFVVAQAAGIASYIATAQQKV
jgi:hypothetical protein